MASEILATTLEVSVVTFSVVSMLAAGLGARLDELIEPLRKSHSVLAALLANFVIVPALGFTIVHALSLDRPIAIGLLLVATAAGAPFLVKLTRTAQGDVMLSATLLILLLPASIVYMPIVVPLLVPEANVSWWAIARPLLLTMLLPLGLGMAARWRFGGKLGALLPWLRRISTLTLVAIILSALLASWNGIVGLFGTGAILAAALLAAGAFAAGYALSTRGPAGRAVLGLGTAQRNVAAAMVVATQALDDSAVTLMVIVASLVGLGILFPLALWLRWKTEGREPRWQRRADRTS